ETFAPRRMPVHGASASGRQAKRAPSIVDDADSGNEWNSSPAGQLASLEPAPVTLKNIRNLSWLQLEQIVAASFRKRGFDAELTAEGPDGGVDIVLRKSDDISLVQCKH